MDHHLASALVCHRTHLLEEENEVIAELLCIDAVISVKSLLEVLESEALLAARKSCDHIACDEFDLCSIHLLVTCLCLCYILCRVLFFSTWSLEDEEVECKECCALESEGTASVRQV